MFSKFTPFQTRAPMIHGYTEFTRETTIELSVPLNFHKKIKILNINEVTLKTRLEKNQYAGDNRR